MLEISCSGGRSLVSYCGRFLLAAVGLLCPLTVQADLVETIQHVKPSVIAIGRLAENGHEPAFVAGAGFAVADGRLVLTAANVFHSRKRSRVAKPLVGFVWRNAKTEVRQLHLVREDRAHGLALLAIDGAPLPVVDFTADGAAKEGQTVAFIGFPTRTRFGFYAATHRGIISAKTPITLPQPQTEQLDAAMILQLRSGFQVLQLDATAHAGNDGGPVFDVATGQVLGIVANGFIKRLKETALRRPTGLAYAIPIRYARIILAGRNAAPTQ